MFWFVYLLVVSFVIADDGHLSAIDKRSPAAQKTLTWILHNVNKRENYNNKVKIIQVHSVKRQVSSDRVVMTIINFLAH